MIWKADNVTIIAEVGTNHNGDLDTALQLIAVAARCGADVVKFQSFLADDLLAQDDANRDRLRRLEMPRDWYPRLMACCRDNGVAFLSTATNFTTLEWMEQLGAIGYKVASCNITHAPLIDRLIALNKPLVISLGMATLDEIVALAERFDRAGFDRYAVMHCVSQYPAPPASMHLGNIAVLRKLLPCPVGLSDHSQGTHIAVAAVALGAAIVEKHISLDKQGIGMDHEVAILPEQFERLCRAVRDTEQALAVDFRPDRQVIHAMRRSLHFARALDAGRRLRAEDVKVVRPEDGLAPSQFERVIGLALRHPVRAGQPLRWEDFNGDA